MKSELSGHRPDVRFAASSFLSTPLDYLDVEVDGASAKVAVSGPVDGIPVLFIHGFGSTPVFANRRTMATIAAAHALTAANIRIIAPVLPGFGGTPPTTGKPSFDAYARWCAACMQSLNVAKAAIVVGESMGGGVAMEYARVFPQDVAAVALFNSVGAPDPQRNRRSWFFGVMKGALPRHRRMTQWAFSIIDATLLFRHPLNAWRMFGAITTADLTTTMQTLAETEIPVAAVFGCDDPVIPLGAAGEFSRYLQVNARLIHGDHRSFIDGHPAIAQIVGILANDLSRGTATSRDPLATVGSLVDEGENVELAVESAGHATPGAPVVVGIHGCGLSGNTLAPLAEKVAPHGRFLAPDLPGFGHSRRPRQVLDVDAHAQVLSDWLDATNIQSAVLVGHSLGCQIAVALAELRPDIVKSCVLIGPTVDASARSVVRQLCRAVWDAAGEPPGYVVAATRDYWRAGVRTLWRTGRFACADRIDARLRNLELRVAIIRGVNDRLVPMSWARTLQQLCMRGELHVVSNAAHATHWSQADTVAEIVIDHLRRDRLPDLKLGHEPSSSHR